MKLTLDLLGPPRLMGARQHCELASGSLAVGRSPESDWVIPDTDRLISRRHLRIDASHGDFVLTDTSANGVYVNGSDEPVGFGASCKLRSGDRLRIGEAQIAVNIEAGPVPADAFGGSAATPPGPPPAERPRDLLGGPFGPSPERTAGAAPTVPQAGQAQPAPRQPIDANWMNDPLSTAAPFPAARDASVVVPMRAAGQARGAVPAIAAPPSLLALIEKHPEVPIRRLAAAVDDVGQTLNAPTWAALYDKIKHLMGIEDQ